jgi:uracil-DNA glycosylase
MKIKGWDLKYFETGEWQVCDERLKDLEKVSLPGFPGYNPGRKHLFEALRRTPSSEVKVAIIGQDPYPDKRFATGLAFSIPGDYLPADWPPTLKTFLGEYSSDLRLPLPDRGDLGRWASAGVLLWNVIPSVSRAGPMSHDWREYEGLTREIIGVLSKKGVVFAFLGQVARRYVSGIDLRNNHILTTSHPSPRGSINSRTPFVGSRLFSTINDRLTDLGQSPIDWRL